MLHPYVTIAMTDQVCASIRRSGPRHRRCTIATSPIPKEPDRARQHPCDPDPDRDQGARPRSRTRPRNKLYRDDVRHFALWSCPELPPPARVRAAAFRHGTGRSAHVRHARRIRIRYHGADRRGDGDVGARAERSGAGAARRGGITLPRSRASRDAVCRCAAHRRPARRGDRRIPASDRARYASLRRLVRQRLRRTNAGGRGRRRRMPARSSAFVARSAPTHSSISARHSSISARRTPQSSIRSAPATPTTRCCAAPRLPRSPASFRASRVLTTPPFSRRAAAGRQRRQVGWCRSNGVGAVRRAMAAGCGSAMSRRSLARAIG